MKANVQLSDRSEKILQKIKTLGAINNISLPNKETQIEKGLEWLDQLITFLDDVDLEQMINIKKTL